MYQEWYFRISNPMGGLFGLPTFQLRNPYLTANNIPNQKKLWVYSSDMNGIGYLPLPESSGEEANEVVMQLWKRLFCSATLEETLSALQEFFHVLAVTKPEAGKADYEALVKEYGKDNVYPIGTAYIAVEEIEGKVSE